MSEKWNDTLVRYPPEAQVTCFSALGWRDAIFLFLPGGLTIIPRKQEARSKKLYESLSSEELVSQTSTIVQWTSMLLSEASILPVP